MKKYPVILLAVVLLASALLASACGNAPGASVRKAVAESVMHGKVIAEPYSHYGVSRFLVCVEQDLYIAHVESDANGTVTVVYKEKVLNTQCLRRN